MASKDENLRGVSGRRALASMLGFDTAQTYKLTADVAGGIIPALSPVVIAKDGTGKVYTADHVRRNGRSRIHRLGAPRRNR